MNAPTKLKLFLILLVVSCLVSGCASIGRDFNYQQCRSFALGELKSSEYKSYLGDPFVLEITETSEGKFELARYVYAFADLETSRVRSFDLEFKNGILNAYTYLSSFDIDKTTVDREKTRQIKRGITRSNDLLPILGEPHGKARCPSEHPDFKKQCGENSIEVWTWSVMDPLSTFGAAYGEDQVSGCSIFITFNKDGVVEEVVTKQMIDP